MCVGHAFWTERHICFAPQIFFFTLSWFSITPSRYLPLICDLTHVLLFFKIFAFVKPPHALIPVVVSVLEHFAVSSSRGFTGVIGIIIPGAGQACRGTSGV